MRITKRSPRWARTTDEGRPTRSQPPSETASWPGGEPDEARHAPAGRLAAMREETAGVRIRAESAALHRPHAGRRERVAREAVEIGLPAAARIRQETPARGRAAREERVADLAADLVRRLSDGRPEPRDEVLRIAAECSDGGRQHAVQEAAPAGMGDADASAAAIAEQNGQAVGRHHDAGDAGRAR